MMSLEAIIITVTGDYHFVNFQPQQPQGISFSLFD
jgi:hypothetical protein